MVEAQPKFSIEQAAALVVDVVGIAVDGRAERDDRLQRRRLLGRHLQAVEAAPGDAHHADLAGAPGLRRRARRSRRRRPAIPARNIRPPSALRNRRCRACRRGSRRSRGRRNRGGSAGRARWCRRACGRAGARGSPAPDSGSASSGIQTRADSRQPSGMTIPMSGNSTTLRGKSVMVFMHGSPGRSERMKPHGMKPSRRPYCVAYATTIWRCTSVTSRNCAVPADSTNTSGRYAWITARRLRSMASFRKSFGMSRCGLRKGRPSRHVKIGRHTLRCDRVHRVQCDRPKIR